MTIPRPTDAKALLSARSLKTTGRPLAATSPYDQGSASPSEPRVSTARTLHLWLAEPGLLRPPTAVLPRLVVGGRVTLLSGREKIGKSTLVACTVATASHGDDVLGVGIARPLNTLWYTIDEPIGDSVRRFEQLGADAGRIAINTDPRTESELLTALEVDLDTFEGIDLVVVDTLSRVLAASGVDPNSSREVEPVMARLVDYFHRKNVAAILLYHTGKSGNDYRGSTAIGATVDDILTLRRRGQSKDDDDFDDESSDDGRRLLVQDGRNLRGRVQLCCAAGVYQLFADALPPRTRLLEALRDNGAVRSRGELAKLARVRKGDGLREVAAMIADGAIEETRGQLKLTPVGESELGSGIHERPAPFIAPEPAAEGVQFPSSLRFSEPGTAPEPKREPLTPPPALSGSPLLHPHPVGTGTTHQAKPEFRLQL